MESNTINNEVYFDEFTIFIHYEWRERNYMNCTNFSDATEISKLYSKKFVRCGVPFQFELVYIFNNFPPDSISQLRAVVGFPYTHTHTHKNRYFSLALSGYSEM